MENNINNLRLFDLLDNLQKMPHKPDAVAGKDKNGWRKYSTSEFKETVDNLSYAFIKMGIQPGEKISIISKNCPEWHFIDFASSQAGCINTPLYPTISVHDLKHIIKDASIKYFFVQNKELHDHVLNCMDGEAVKGIYTFEQSPGITNIQEVIEIGKQSQNAEALQNIKNNIKSADLATLLYTSGTTGKPKGVMLSHLNFLSNVYATKDLCPFNPTWRALSFLPLNHVYERMICYVFFCTGMSIYYAESMETIADNLKEVKPQVFVTVPRLLEKVYEAIMLKGAALTGIKKKLFDWAIQLGLNYQEHGKNSFFYEMQLKVANKLIFSKWREALGGNIEGIVSGGSALQPRLARIFHAGKIRVLEGYGLTETSPVIAVNNYDPQYSKIGTVGPVINNVQLKFTEDGEICVKGPNVMLGYYNLPELTAECFDEDGWFHTGDIGILEDNKFLKITDRKKEMFKTSGGKYITPQVTENKLKESKFIEQVIVVGENERFPGALIVPSFKQLKAWCQLEGIDYQSDEKIIEEERILELINNEVAKINTNLSHHEQIKKVNLLGKEWSVEGGELTPKMSLKRKYIIEKYQKNYEQIYRA